MDGNHRSLDSFARLGQVCTQLGNPQLLIRPALWREALDTSASKDSSGKLRDLLEAQLPGIEYLTPETAEIRAYFQMAEYAFGAIYQRPLTIALLSELQERLLEKRRADHREVGHVRERQVWIGEEDRPIKRLASYPFQRMIGSGRALTHGRRGFEPPILTLRRCCVRRSLTTSSRRCTRSATAMGVLVGWWSSSNCSATEQSTTPRSPFLPGSSSERESYQDHLLSVSCTGEWDPWVTFFSEAIRDQCVSLSAGAQRLLRWIEDARRVIHERRWTAQYTASSTGC